MRCNGRWLQCDDGIVRPIIEASVPASDGSWLPVEMLLDVGADRTVFTAPFLAALGLPPLPAPHQLGGVGGAVVTVLVDAEIRLMLDDGRTVALKGRFAAFTEPEALDMCVIGRDISNLFAVIVDYPGQIVCMVSQRHTYSIAEQP